MAALRLAAGVPCRLWQVTCTLVCATFDRSVRRGAEQQGDAYRTSLFSLCQFYMNGALNQQDVRPLLEKLIGTYRVTQPVGAVAAVAAAQAASAAAK